MKVYNKKKLALYTHYFSFYNKKMTSVLGNKNSLKLHIGCGNKYLPQWTHVDLIPGEKVDIVADMSNLRSCVQDNSVDEIYICHALEHVETTKRKSKNRYEHLMPVFNEFLRILKPGGQLRIAVPDFEAVAAAYNNHEVPLTHLLGLLYGGAKNKWDYHFTTFDLKTLTQVLESHGFENIQPYKWQDFLPVNFDDYSRAYIPHLNEKGRLMSLNIICNKKKK